jgi:hypothetical protein
MASLAEMYKSGAITAVMALQAISSGSVIRKNSAASGVRMSDET